MSSSGPPPLLKHTPHNGASVLKGVTGTRKRHCEVFFPVAPGHCGEPLHTPAGRLCPAPRGYDEVMTPQQGCGSRAYRAENHPTKSVHIPGKMLRRTVRNMSRFRTAKIGA